ncbi:MAG: TldD/PmbA family protein [Candidatus Heimdallarchaeota archaeon]
MSLKSFATEAIEYAQKTDADYIDVRVENLFSNQTGLRNSETCGVNANLQRNIGIRVLYKNCWGFAASSSLNKTSIKQLVKSAFKTAKKVAAQNSAPPIKIASIPRKKTSVADKCKKDPQFLEQSERIELLNTISSRVKGALPVLKMFDIKLLEEHTQKIFMNSEGIEIEQILIRASMFLASILRGAGNVQTFRTMGFGGVGGLEQFETCQFDEFLIDYIKTLRNLTQAKLLKPKEQPVILNEMMSWNLCHEFCHAVEYDLIQQGLSPLQNKIGTKIGSELVTIIDDASFKGFGEYYFDDEGVKASGTLIIEDGLLFDFLQNRETAGGSKAIPTSNGRAESALNLPEVRQSNTFFEPGNHSFEELLESTRCGLFVSDTFGATADISTGSFQLDAQFGRKIERGELGDYVVGFSITGNLYHVLGDVVGISKTLGSYPSFCGKNGQLVPVGAISPKLALKRINVISTTKQRSLRKIDFKEVRSNS